MKKIGIILSGMVMLSTVSCLKAKVDEPVIVPPDTTGVGKIQYREKAKQVYQDILLKNFRIAGTNRFVESAPRQSGDPAEAYFWPYTGVFTGAALLEKIGVDNNLEDIYNGLEEYWDPTRLPAGYQSARTAGGLADRYYDDNGTVGLNLVEAYEATNDVKYLDKAEASLVFAMSGEINDTEGGMYWCEQYRNNNPSHPSAVRAANVVAFTASLALKVNQHRPKQEYLDFARRMYSWNMSKMQDPADKLIWNDIALASGQVNRTKWTYNTGEMITAACLLYQATQDGSYLSDAKMMAKASYDHFTSPFSDKGRFFPDHDSWFNAILFRAYLDLYAIDKAAASEYINAFIRQADYAWDHARTKDGMFYEDWSGNRMGRFYWLMHQAVMVEVYSRISIFKNEQ